MTTDPDDSADTDGARASRAPGAADGSARDSVPASRLKLAGVGAVTVAAAVVMAYAFDPAHAGDRRALIAIAGLYASIGAVVLGRLARSGGLATVLRPAVGDISLGAVTAGLLYGLAKLGQLVLATPGTPRVAWVMRLYLQIGDVVPANPLQGLEEPGPLLSIAIGIVGAFEEVVWRGFVQRSLVARLGSRRAVLFTSALFALAHTPTLIGLRDAAVGYNPLVVTAAFTCSVVWGALAIRTGRLVPSIIAHALFSWSVVEFPLWRP